MNVLTPVRNTALLDNTSLLYKVLLCALSQKRPHGSKTNDLFTKWLRASLPKGTGENAWVDRIGNLHVDARRGASRTLFVAHVDTVHGREGRNLVRVAKNEFKAHGDVLGADDGAGVAMLMNLLDHGVPGYYIFTQGEERGGIGAKYLADEHSDLLGQFDRAIAFDRRGLDSVISHQGWGRCCSDEFANALAGALNQANEEFMYSPDDTGVYTDTAEFVDWIPECTNISVGYFSEHTTNERLSLSHYAALARAAVALDWESLPVARDPSVVDDWKSWSVYDWSKSSSTGQLDDEMQHVLDCLDDAIQGHTKPLVHAIGDAVLPDDPASARRLVNPNKITPELCDLYMSMALSSEYIDADDLLHDMFDETCDIG